MTIYYHGTDARNEKSMKEKGLLIGTKEGNTFGDAIYLCEDEENAMDFGNMVLAVDVDDIGIKELYMSESDIVYDDTEWATEFRQKIIDSGCGIVRIEREEGFFEVVLYKSELLKSWHVHWKCSFLK